MQQGLGSHEKTADIHALVSRHWYSTYREQVWLRRQAKMPSDLRPIRLPRNCWTNGDWHLGILDGSIGPRRGFEIIRDVFASEAVAIGLAADGVGLPALREFYTDPGLSSLTEWPLSWFQPYVDGQRVICRSLLRQYRRTAPALAHLLMGLKTSESFGRDASAAADYTKNLCQMLGHMRDRED